MSWHDPVIVFFIAFALTGLLTPYVAKLAIKLKAVDQPNRRSIARGGTPLLGGLAMFVGISASMLLIAGSNPKVGTILLGATLITFVGVLDDRFDLPPIVKITGQALAAWIPVGNGLAIEYVTLPWIHRVEFGWVGEVLTLIAFVGLMNMINFSDGVDGLAAGVCAIAAIALGVVAWDLYQSRTETGGDIASLVAVSVALAAAVAGSSIGFLFHNFSPASIFMGDTGANLLGYLLGVIAVAGSVKTNALIAVAGPVCVFALPLADTAFVMVKRVRSGKPVYEADQNHLHHRLRQIGFSDRKTVLLLYGWSASLAVLAIALRFVPYRATPSSPYDPFWSSLLALLGLLVIAISIYVFYLLEIVRLRRVDGQRLRAINSDTTDSEINSDVISAMETGEVDRITAEFRAAHKRRR